MRYPFLSPEWIEAMRQIRAEYADYDGPVDFVLAANVTVTNPPFGDGPILGHIDTSGPALMIEQGHLEAADFGIEVPYELARDLFVKRDPAAVMPALMGGQIKLTGDSSKVLGLASVLAPGSSAPLPDGSAPPASVIDQVISRIDEITEQ
jgi:hypothetical protein